MRWAVAAGPIEPGSGPATEWSGDAFLEARRIIDEARRRRDGLLVLTGDPAADRLLDDLAPLLAEMIDGLSRRQRVVARLMLVDDLRQAEVAERLGISRASVSVTAARGHVRSLGRLVRAIRTLFSEATHGLARA
jgi:DNA-directed RNA polymerase specialized sigma24 family protein